MTHAFFKGLLFLGCGSVIHGMHEEQNIRKMGGLRKYMPITFWTFLIAALANAGVIPLAGLLEQGRDHRRRPGSATTNVGKLVAVVGLVAAFLTAFYMFRLVFLVFFAQGALRHRARPPARSPVVDGGAAGHPGGAAVGLIGFVGLPPEDGPIHHFLEPVFAGESSRPRTRPVRPARMSPRSTLSRKVAGREGDGATDEEQPKRAPRARPPR